ncbi:hypothetical protein GCM10012275_00960 [Longimycelium tulufanense]|uniref:OmpR-like protein n=1 Tax=Longimycelium tulufanense TaxID=907463 RepID=A0A8J3C9D5_9PSEU|nr:hypothetical protein GCM10012275_00960 [Longimycelium tulufanense]
MNSGAEALNRHQHAHLVLLDLNLSDLDGIEVCREIRASSDTPIIAITDRDTGVDGVLVLQAGADDCVVRPYAFRELTARIEAVVRRSRLGGETARAISRGPLYVDANTREVRLHDQQISLTRKEFDFLHLLASQPETVFSRRQIIAKVWDDVVPTSSRTIDTHVSNLRSKLGASRWIVTVRGVGFRLGGV